MMVYTRRGIGKISRERERERGKKKEKLQTKLGPQIPTRNLTFRNYTFFIQNNNLKIL